MPQDTGQSGQAQTRASWEAVVWDAGYIFSDVSSVPLMALQTHLTVTVIRGVMGTCSCRAGLTTWGPAGS